MITNDFINVIFKKVLFPDANKFGQKMLEKMGWQQGKGLGANENGITEHIKMSYKNDSKGKY